ncbi:MAG: penicillin-binding transpeptidase domain-containing protein [Candidatus Auribacterota bacterium]
MRFRGNVRIVILLFCCVIVFCSLLGRLYFLQQYKTLDFMQLARFQHLSKVQEHPQRGKILDRNGKPLAVNLIVDSVFADPRKVTDPHLCAYHLSEILGVDEKKLYERLTRKKSFVWVKRHVLKETTEQIAALKLDGIFFKEEITRYYPKESIASHILGFVGIDGKGLEGIEAALNSELQGEMGWKIVTKDAKRREVAHYMPTYKPAKNGNNVELTIDEVIQYIAESELQKGFEKHQPEWAGVIVMRPYTGEILAMATRPTYNPNYFGDYPTENRRNRIISDIFEPGSTFKIISCSAALNEGAVRFDDVFDCENGAFRVFRHTLHDSHPYGLLTVPEIIAVSSNIGTAKIAMNLGQDKLYEYLKRYEFGDSPDLVLHGEEGGILRPLKSWSGLSIVCIPMGQEISVSALQMVKAVSTIANDGTLMKPYVLKKITSPEGEVLYEGKPQAVREVISPKTAKQMNEALKLVVARGTGLNAALEEYAVAGKTGTAQKVVNGRYSHSKFVGSFIGYVPADNPEITIMVVLDAPKGQYYGGTVAAPIFKEVARKVLQYLEIPPEQNNQTVSTNQQGNGRI